MRMSTKGRFAVQAMIDLALRERCGPIALATIAQRQGVSLSYLEQLFSRLRRAGLVDSTRGPGGGYSLTRRSQDITVADIVAAVRDDEDAPAMGPRAQLSLTSELCASLDEVMLQHLTGISLRTLADEQRAKGVVVDETPARRLLPAPATPRPVRTTAPNSVFAFGQSFAKR